MRYYIITILLFVCFQLKSYGQKTLIVTRNSIEISEQKIIESTIEECKKAHPHSWRHKKNYLSSDLNRFINTVIIVDGLINSIEFKDSTLLISYEPEFYQWSNLEDVFYFYHDLYQSFFSYKEIKNVSIVLTDGTNLTFLPTITTDSWMPMENALFKKEWFIPDIDYVSFLGVLEVEAGNYSNENFEYKADKVETKIKEYRSLIERD
jgi:hypothetical protein